MVTINGKSRAAQQPLAAAVDQAAGHIHPFLHDRSQAAAFGRVSYQSIRAGEPQPQSHPAQQVVTQLDFGFGWLESEGAHEPMY